MKYRRKILIKREYIDYLCYLVEEIAERYEFEIEELGSDGDHVRVPVLSPSEIFSFQSHTNHKEHNRTDDVQESSLKSRSSCGVENSWSDGGFVGTVDQTLGLEGLRKYIKKQGTKGKNYRLEEFLG